MSYLCRKSYKQLCLVLPASFRCELGTHLDSFQGRCLPELALFQRCMRMTTRHAENLC